MSNRAILWTRRGGFAFAVLGAAHLVIDAYSSGYAPILALLRDRLGLTLAQVGGCTAVLAFSSSLLQPLYGVLSDRLRTRLMIALAPAITATGLGALAWSSGYPSALFLFFVAGIGMAAFHPQGAAQATEVAPRRPGLAMSLFIASGNLGFAFGPILAGMAVGTWGWSGLWRVAIPGVAATLVLLWLAPEPQGGPRPVGSSVATSLRRYWKPLFLLYLLVVVRGVVQLSYVGFLPLYFITLGYNLSSASWALSVFLAAGLTGGLVGGVLSDRIGHRRVIRASMSGAPPFFVLAFFLPTGWQIAVLSAGYFILMLTMPVYIVMAQEWIPEHRSTVSSLMMGFAWGVGGIAAPLVGKVADLFDLQTALLIVGMAPVIGIWLARWIPDRPAKGEAAAGEGAGYRAAAPVSEC